MPRLRSIPENQAVAYAKVADNRTFWGHVHKTESCWLWGGAVTSGGYARFNVYVGEAGQALVLAHRFIYQFFKGPIEEGLVLDHLCRVRHCVNPDHLEPVSQGENLRRGVGVNGINARKKTCIRGHQFDGVTVSSSGKTQRVCNECRRITSSRRRATKRREEDAA